MIFPTLTKWTNDLRIPPREGRPVKAGGKAEAGYTPVQVAGSLIVMAIMGGVLGSAVNQQIKRSRDDVAANQLNEVYTASQNWVKAHTQDLENLVSESGGVYQLPAGRSSQSSSIPEDSLQGQGFMPSGFIDSNPYGQQSIMAVWADPNTAGAYDMAVFTNGGRSIADGDIGRISQKLPASGGGYYSNSTSGRPAGMVVGAAGGWSYPASDMGGSYGTPQPGHVAASGQFTINGGLADFLYRNDIGVHEANTMHAPIDMTQHQLNAVSGINNYNPTTMTANGPLAVGSPLIGSNLSDTNDKQLYIERQIVACSNDPDPNNTCGITVNPKVGGFYRNGNWMVFNGTAGGGGLHVEGEGNNFQVDGGSNLVGQITAQTGLDLINGGPITWSNAAPGLTVRGDNSSGRGAQLHILGRPVTIDAMTYLDGNVTTRFMYDTDNGNYYLHPSGASRLESANFTGTIGTRGYDKDTYPENVIGGIHTYDVYAEGGIYAGHDGHANSMMSRDGTIAGAQVVAGGVLRPLLQAANGQPCQVNTGASTVWGSGTSAASYTPKQGDIAKDGVGRTLTCVAGTWQYPGGMQYSNRIIDHRCNTTSWSNNSTRTRLEVLAFHAGHKGATATVVMDGQEVGYVDWSDGDGRVSSTVTFPLPPGSSWWLESVNRVNDLCLNEFE